MTRRSLLTTLLSMLPIPFLLGTRKMFPKNLQQEFRKDGLVPVQSQTPDYAVLRAQTGDYTSTYYGPHPCQHCGVEIIKQAEEQGGEEYERCNWGSYGRHVCQPFKNDKFYDLFVDNKGNLIDGTEIRPFLDWTPQRSHQPRWARIVYAKHNTRFGMTLPSEKSHIVTYLDSEIYPVVDTVDASGGDLCYPRSEAGSKEIETCMSSVYSAALTIATSVQGVSLEGGGLVSAIPSKLLVVIANTNILSVQGIYDLEQQAYWTTAATLSGTLLDQYGNTITTVALAYASGSNGNFSATFGGFTFSPEVGRGYTMLLQGTSDWGHDFSLPILAEVTNDTSG